MSFLKRLYLLAFMLAAYVLFPQDSVCDKSCNCYSRPDFHAPIGVMIDHGHDRGQWMVSYRYMNMGMQGNLSGSSRISNNDIMKSYIMAPEKMTMQMHMLMLMYGITNRITVMGMANYSVNDMSMTMTMYGMMNMAGMSMGSMNMEAMNSTMQMKDHTAGLSDSKLYVLYRLIRRTNHELLVSNGVNLPTGSISQHGNVMGQDQKKTYPMQLGTGTYAWLPGLTYMGNSMHFSWGVQATGIINFGVNKYNYCWGNTATATGWFSYKWNNWLSNSVRAEASALGTMYGWDKDISPYRTTDPTADIKNTGSQRLGVFAGLNFLIPKGVLRGNQICVEYGVPVYQNVNGIQMKMTQMINAGWQMSF